MIKVTKLNGERFYVNPFEVEFIEETPDTVISLKSGKKILVTESADTVVDEMVAFYRRAVVIARSFETKNGYNSRPRVDEDDPYI
ncbi:MAG: flagellar FlbD family protein [Ethanoligenens sp.]|uniref:flagellar FlbD family protein n=1 Tax=Ethanoligenens sp. TaxID=2099655 RepID=UPI0039EB3964